MNTLLNHKTGDVVVLSSLGIMEDHNVTELECEIVETRHYRDPNGLFNYTGYVCKPMNADITYMVLIREVGSDHDIILYYCDKGLDIKEAAPFVLTPDGLDLLPSYSITVYDTNDQPHEIIWEKKSAGTFFGVNYSDDEVKGIKTLCEYFSNSDCGGNPHTFIDWSGDNTTGWIEFWIRNVISDIEVSIYTPSKPL